MWNIRKSGFRHVATTQYIRQSAMPAPASLVCQGVEHSQKLFRYECLYAFLRVYVYASMFTRIHVQLVCVCVYLHTCIYMYIGMYVCLHIFINTMLVYTWGDLGVILRPCLGQRPKFYPVELPPAEVGNHLGAILGPC